MAQDDGGFGQKKTPYTDRQRVKSLMKLSKLLQELELEARDAQLNLTAHLIAVANESVMETVLVPAGRKVRSGHSFSEDFAADDDSEGLV